MEFHDLPKGIINNPITENIFVKNSNESQGQPGEALAILTETEIEIETEDGITITTEG